jgi:hypothetical protein
LFLSQEEPYLRGAEGVAHGGRRKLWTMHYYHLLSQIPLGVQLHRAHLGLLKGGYHRRTCAYNKFAADL